MRKSWLLIICLFGLTQNVFSAIHRPTADIEDVAEVQLNPVWHFHGQAPQVPELNVSDPNSVVRFIQAVQNDCMKATWEDSEKVLSEHLLLARSQFFTLFNEVNVDNKKRDMALSIVSRESVEAYLIRAMQESFYRKLLNALDIVALRILNKKQEAAALATQTR